jgi:MarR family transcriptional regulator, transcriptional regulator for hemolysin
VVDPVASWSALVGVYQSVLHEVVAALDEEAGMDSGIFSALAYLERAQPPHRMAMSALQQAMHPRYSQPGFSRLVQRMEGDGLVERRADPDDGRATIVMTTRAGRSQFAAANEVYNAALRESFGRHLRAGEHAQLTALMTTVTARRATAAGRDR